MFLLRSAFWLTVAFIVIAPRDVDLGARANDLSAQALAAGQQVVVSRILEQDCTTVECLGARAVVAVALPELPSVGTPMHDSPTDPVPFPRPRPDWMG